MRRGTFGKASPNARSSAVMAGWQLCTRLLPDPVPLLTFPAVGGGAWYPALGWGLVTSDYFIIRISGRPAR